MEGGSVRIDVLEDFTSDMMSREGGKLALGGIVMRNSLHKEGIIEFLILFLGFGVPSQVTGWDPWFQTAPTGPGDQNWTKKTEN